MPKSDLTLVSPSATQRKPRQTGADLIKVINEEFELDSSGLVLLNETASTLDRLNDVTARISRDGVMVKWGRSMRPHPLLKMELQLRTLIGRNLHRLGIGLDPVGNVGRPGSAVGITFGDDD